MDDNNQTHDIEHCKCKCIILCSILFRKYERGKLKASEHTKNNIIMLFCFRYPVEQHSVMVIKSVEQTSGFCYLLACVDGGFSGNVCLGNVC